MPSMQGRDANRRLQRAIRAGRARERLPAVVQHVTDALAAWRETYARPFWYNNGTIEVRHPVFITLRCQRPCSFV